MHYPGRRVEEQPVVLTHGDLIPLEQCNGLTYSGLFNRYAESEYGLWHAEQPLRYSQYYAYDPAQMLKDLGDDIHPVRHMSYTEARIFRPLIAWQRLEQNFQYKPFSAEDIAVGRLGSLLHDIGECTHPDLIPIFGKLVGDKHVHRKTKADKILEGKIRRYLVGKIYADLPEDLLEAIEDTVDNESGNFRREAFATTERIGYFLTGMQAGRVALRIAAGKDLEKPDELRLTQLRTLAKKVTHDWFDELVERGKDFAFARHVTRDNEREYHELQENLV